MDEITNYIIIICRIIASAVSFLYIFRAIYVIIGLFKVKKYPKAKKLHKIGIVIAARNESAVIGKLLDSINRQSYPKNRFKTFVVADNCTDGGATASIARSGGSVCYERFDGEHRTKGYALEYLFKHIDEDYGIQSFDGYIVVDADNLLDAEYLSKMNDAFDSGEKIIVSYRMSKNFFDNWISFSYGVHWLTTIWAEHRARSVLGLATRIQGTGYMFSSELVKDGWHYTSLTEDREFAADAVLKGYKIGYCDDAVFYDEQPTSFKIAMRQRLRWSKGHLKVFASKGGKLLKNVFKSPFTKQSFINFDMFLITTPEALIYLFLDMITVIASALSPEYTALLTTWLINRAVSYLTKCLPAIYVLIRDYKRIPGKDPVKILPYVLMSPLFHIIGKVTLTAALFCRVEWKPIPHTVSVDVAEIDESRK